jgi:hemoglobin/transferrin/lactoferrin receptor protein
MKSCVAECSASKSFVCAICVGIATTFAALPAAQPSWAQEVATGIAYNIPAGNLGPALTQWAQVSGFELLAPGNVLEGRTTTGLSGSYVPVDALGTLLAGTGLIYTLSGTTVTVTDESADAGATVEGAIALDTITVSGGESSDAGFQGTPDWVYETPASVSVVTREAIKNTVARDARELFASVPGVYTGEGNPAFPAVSPNIRGLQDSGRIVVSIDGARQNAQRGMTFGSAGYNSNSGFAFVDSAFIREVDISKNPDASSGNASSLGGSVEFRTLGADDLIAPGETAGTEINLTSGTNEYDFQGSLLTAARLGEYLSLTAGFSRTDLGEYEPGGGREWDWNANAYFMGRKTWSSLLKLELDDHEGLTASLSWMRQDLEFKYGYDTSENFEHAVNDSATAKIAWNPESALVDVKATLWLNNSQGDEVREARLSGNPPDTYLDLDTLSFGGVLENTSRFDTAAGGLSLNYGVEAFRDKATSSATSTTIAQNPLWASRYTAFSPPGQRDIASGFLNGEFKPAEWVTVSGGVRYDWARLHGTPTYYDQNSEVICRKTLFEWYLEVLGFIPPGSVDSCFDSEVVRTYPAHTVDIDRTDAAWLPSATVEFKPVDWFRPYASYSQSFRAPTILEAFLTGGPPGDSVGINFAPNVALRPETARTWEVGTNISYDALLTERDSVRIKAAAFDREIDDYIVMGTILTAEEPDRTYSSFVNLDGPTRMRGVELEGNYDARLFWIGAAATWLKTEWPQKTEIFSNGTIVTDGGIFAVPGNVPPDFKLTLDGGVRLFDEKLSIGARYSKVSPTQTRTLDANGNLNEISEAYEIVDLYGAFRPNENITFRFAINNLTDAYYVPATGGVNFAAPGRTVTVTTNVKF